jgi:hypothetical protein
MRVEFLRDWRWFKCGQVIDMAGGRADLLNRIGITREAIEKPVVKTKSSKAKKKTTKKKRSPRRKKAE